jgi:hypothetical protein
VRVALLRYCVIALLRYCVIALLRVLRIYIVSHDALRVACCALQVVPYELLRVFVLRILWCVQCSLLLYCLFLKVQPAHLLSSPQLVHICCSVLNIFCVCAHEVRCMLYKIARNNDTMS